METLIWSYIIGPIAKLCMCHFGPVKIPWGPEGGIVENSPPPPSSHKIGSGKLVRNKKFLLDKPNALE